MKPDTASQTAGAVDHLDIETLFSFEATLSIFDSVMRMPAVSQDNVWERVINRRLEQKLAAALRAKLGEVPPLKAAA